VDKLADCDVHVPETLRMGAFANSFRVLHDGGDLFFDFVKYSPGEHKAEVVARVRVSFDLVRAIKARISKLLSPH
jgi:hypothetical protein